MNNKIDDFFVFEEKRKEECERLHIPFLRQKKDSYIALNKKQRTTLLFYIKLAIDVTKETGEKHVVTYRIPRSKGGRIKSGNLKVVKLGDEK
jgi:hypothetical protein